MATVTQEKVIYEDYLLSIGDTLDCYFTIERLADTETHTSPFSVADIVPEDVPTIDALVQKLNNDMPGVTVLRSDTNPKVVHLIETCLRNIPAYVVDQTTSMTFSGTVEDLLDQLSQQVPAIGKTTRGFIPAGPEDYLTAATANAQNQTIRNLLGNAVALPGYCRIVWEATTYQQNATYSTEVKYSGPKVW